MKALSKIQLTSPSGKKFEAAWIGDSRSVSKRVEKFEYANVNGTASRDWGSSGVTYPLTFKFVGKNFEDQAKNFIDAIRYEQGIWGIVHPVRGHIALQPLSATESMQPVKDAAGIEISTEWFESLRLGTLENYTDLFKDKYKDEFNDSIAKRFEKKIPHKTFSERFKMISAVNNLTDKINEKLKPIADFNTEVATAMLDSQRSLQSLLNASVVKPLAIAHGIINTIQIPMLAVVDLASRLGACVDFAIDLADVTKEFYRVKPGRGLADAFVAELGLSANTVNLTRIAYNGSTEGVSRVLAVDAANKIMATHAKTTEDMGYVQNATEGEYVMGGHEYDAQVKMLLAATNYLLLTVQRVDYTKHIILERDYATVHFVIKYYGPDNVDADFDSFVKLNNLHGEELLVLRKGTEVLVNAGG